MPESRVHKAGFKSLDRAESLRAFEQTGLLAGRWTRKGELTHVKTASMGWIDVRTYDLLKNLKDWQPTIAAVVRGGYEFKAWLWGTSFEISADVLASGTSFTIPFGVILMMVTTALFITDYANGRKAEAALDYASLVLPFGELWLIYHGINDILSWITGSTTEGGTSVPNWLNLLLIMGPLGPGALGAVLEGEQIAVKAGKTIAQAAYDAGEDIYTWLLHPRI